MLSVLPMPELFNQLSSFIAPLTLVTDAAFLLLVLVLCCFKRFHPLVVLRKLLPDARPLAGLFILILFVFLNLYTVAHYFGDSSLRYGEFCHFFNVGDQHIELEAQGTAAEGAEWPFIIACLTALTGNMLLSGVFVSVLVNVFDAMGARIRNGLVTPRIHRESVAILGYRSGMTEALLQRLLEEAGAPRHIILLTEQEVPSLRLALRTALPDRAWKRLHLVHGGWTAQEELRQLKLWRCRDIYLLGEDGEENHDSLCLKALDTIQLLLSQHSRQSRSNRPVCHILWEERDFFNIMLTSDIARFISEGYKERHYDVRVCHLHSMLASNVLIAKDWRPGDDTLCPPLDRISFLQHPERRVHFIIMGMSDFGQALLQAAILQAHYPNFAQDRSRRTLISIIDPQAEAAMERLRNRHPLFFDKVRYEYRSLSSGEQELRCFNEAEELLDLELHFLSGRLESEHVQRFLAAAGEQQGDVVTVAVCLEDSTLSLKTAMSLPPELRRNNIPVYVHQDSEENLLQHNINIRRQTRAGAEGNAPLHRKLHQANAACSNLYPVGCMETLFALHTPDFSLPELFHRTYCCASAEQERRKAGQSSGLDRFEQLCAAAQQASFPPPQVLAEAPAAPAGTWEALFAECLNMAGAAEGVHEQMERLPLIQHSSNRYLAEVQPCRRRQYPAPQGEGREEHWASVLHWLGALMESEHQRWMAERLLNEDPLSAPNPCMVPMENIPPEIQSYDAWLCLATYLIAEQEKGTSSHR